MTGQPASVGPRPNRADMDEATIILRDDFGHRARTDVYPFLVGYLSGIIDQLVELHGNCRRRDCGLCWNLRRAAAILLASKQEAQP